MTNHIVSDMATRIRNAIQAQQPFVKVYKTVLTVSIAKILLSKGFISEVLFLPGIPLKTDEFLPLSSIDEKQISQDGMKKKKKKNQEFLLLKLKYTGNTQVGCLTHIESISKPGVRMYSRANEIPRVLGGLGVVIISTSQGIMTDDKARKYGIGGELLCSVW
jgi:small subunit ribosomal protein S8